MTKIHADELNIDSIPLGQELLVQASWHILREPSRMFRRAKLQVGRSGTGRLAGSKTVTQQKHRAQANQRSFLLGAPAQQQQQQQHPAEKSRHLVEWQLEPARRSTCSNSSSRPAAGPLHVYAPSKEEKAAPSSPASEASFDSVSTPDSVEATNLSREVEGNGLSPTVSTRRILEPVKADMQILHDNLVRIGEKRHPKLGAATRQIFGGGGKRLRPAIVLLVARATAQLNGMSDITDRHRRLAEITEMIHTASLVHDDVLDDCSLRRGQPTVNNVYGTRTAVLAGDYLFAQSSWLLARLQNFEVIELISMVIADFATGEISQSDSLFDVELSMEAYMDKNFYKTASLIASSCRSSAVFSNASSQVKDAMFEYGRHLGLAFQIVDDILDFTQSTEQLGKPQGQDLASGNLTAPAIYALACEGSERLRELIESEFLEDSDLEEAMRIIKEGDGLASARRLARQESDLALASLDCLPECPAKESLQMMVGYVLDRLY